MTQGDLAAPSASTWLRGLWSLPGALTGAAIAFHVYFRQPHLNTDTTAPLLLASLWAVVGLVCGAVISVAAAMLMERGLRRVLPTNATLTSLVTLIFMAVLCGAIYSPIEVRLPALLWPAAPEGVLPPAVDPAGGSACKAAPPTEARLRRLWDEECD